MAKTVLITGASSGIGEGMAKEFAKRGYNLVLAARRKESIDQLSATITKHYPALVIETVKLDVTDVAAVQKVIPALAKLMGTIDIVVANAGVGGGGEIGSDRFSEDAAIIQTNILGAMATIDAAVKLFKQQGSGQIVGIASVAAFRGLPGASVYCASKAAISTYMDALQLELHKSPIDVTCLYPGYIDTPINNKMKSRPFLIDVEKGSQILVELIEKKVKKSTVPVYPWNVVGRLLKVLPQFMLAGRV
ncbi:SDR family oxidoreductase [Alkalimarinus alittae]|uniref:SDR family oxidoreductase n=1 Tax=Alkalimarinus alittae TaxID=2961619 RepID=A0ABY6MZ11_9ALTE|nr:SDR family oxidoreductase [Alkalimarinus alittae]UZE95035.1 SDR family oxidoreductase [Alkalimarinus alittae]